MNRKGFELAVNTLVVLILGFIIVGGGILLLAQILEGEGALAQEISAQQAQEVREQLTRGKLVAVYPTSTHAESGDSVIIALGIENRLRDGENFSVAIRGYDASDNLGPTSWATYFDAVQVPANAQRSFPLVIEIPETASPGTYTFVVEVLDENALPYDSKRSFIVKI